MYNVSKNGYAISKKMTIDIIEEDDNDIIYVSYGEENYMIKRSYIGGTLIENYWLFGCYGNNDYEYELGGYPTFEKALKEIKNRGEF